MSTSTAPIAYLTSGAGGMFCGSCLHDNTLARALLRQGIETLLIPTYTPIRTDEEDVTAGPVHYGGLNVFLSQAVPLYRHLPTWMTRWLDHPALIRWATARASATSAASLGALTVSMLRGEKGNQRRELEQLCRWLATDIRPRLVVLSNALIAGFVPRLRKELAVPVLVTLQGDDIFLDSLPEPHRARALEELHRLADHIDGFLVHSRFYGDKMKSLLGLPDHKLHQVPLGIDLSDFQDGGRPPAVAGPLPDTERLPTIGYLARIAPEKGFHLLVDAYIQLCRRGVSPPARLAAAGWLGSHQQTYFREQVHKLDAAGLANYFEYRGTVSRSEKVTFLRGLDLFCVPTTYQEPKGLFVFEALAAGVPVVLPAHGAFPELLARIGGGLLVPPHEARPLAEGLHQLLADPQERRRLAEQGRAGVWAHGSAEAMAAATWKVWQEFLPRGA